MILIDFSSVSFITACGFKDLRAGRDNFFRTLIDYIEYYKFKYSQFGELYLCIDWKPYYWRHLVYPFYKQKKKNVANAFDMNILTEFRQEFLSKCAFKIICVKYAECDDIIFTIVKNSQEKVLIASPDKDFIQLNSDNVLQISTMTNKPVNLEKLNPIKHVLTGDGADGVPSAKIKTPLDDSIIQENLSPFLLEQKYGLYDENDKTHYQKTKQVRVKNIRSFDEALEIKSNTGHPVYDKSLIKRNMVLTSANFTPNTIQQAIMVELLNKSKSSVRGRSEMFELLRIPHMTAKKSTFRNKPKSELIWGDF